MSDPEFHQCGTCGYEWRHGQHGGHSCTDTLLSMLFAIQQKLEAAEARIKASQEREPYITKGTYRHGWIATCDYYKSPVIPPDVAELQRENAELKKENTDLRWDGALNDLEDKNAELTRKLAEQQAAIVVAIREAPNVGMKSAIHAEIMCGVVRMLRAILQSEEELTKLLAEAKSKAVPEGWQLVPKEMTDEMRDAGNIYVLNRATLFRIWDDMLSAAPQPETDRG